MAKHQHYHHGGGRDKHVHKDTQKRTRPVITQTRPWTPLNEPNIHKTKPTATRPKPIATHPMETEFGRPITANEQKNKGQSSLKSRPTAIRVQLPKPHWTELPSEPQGQMRKTQPRKKKADLRKEGIQPITPPSYATFGTKSGSLFAPHLKVKWPERPEEGFYSKEYHLHQNEKYGSEPVWKRNYSTSLEYDTSLGPVRFDSATRMNELIARPLGDLCVLGEKYLGLAFKDEAEKKQIKLGQFLLYYAIPDETRESASIHLHLTVIYRTRIGEYRHYRVLSFHGDNRVNKSAHLYYVDCGGESVKKQAYESIEDLVKHHETYGYMTPRAYYGHGTNDIEMIDAFPWWIDDEEKRKKNQY